MNKSNIFLSFAIPEVLIQKKVVVYLDSFSKRIFKPYKPLIIGPGWLSSTGWSKRKKYILRWASILALYRRYIYETGIWLWSL